MKNKNVALVFSILGVAIFIGAIATASYAFFAANVRTEGGTPTTNASTAEIKATFHDDDNNTGGLTVSNIIPGDTITKTFSLENTGTTSIKYKIVIRELENTFTRKNDITYTLIENGTNIKTNETFLSANGPISDTLTINKGEIKTYSLKMTYNNSPDEDQAADMGKTISGKIFIEETN